jgi:deoxyribodipyrimidine photo-lyase
MAEASSAADARPVIVWFRRDLRLADNPALNAATEAGAPVIPLFVLDETEGLRAPGAASRWWLDKSLRALATDLAARGSTLILRRGPAADIVLKLAEETGAGGVVWNRLYDLQTRARDAALKAALKDRGVQAESFNAALLLEPWTVKNKSGEPFRVFTPFWRQARTQIAPIVPHAATGRLAAPVRWPDSEALDSFRLHPTTPDWSEGFSDWTPGEAGAQARLDHFLKTGLAAYPTDRDRPDLIGTSRLSPHLHFGEIGPRQVMHATETAASRDPATARGAEKFLSELGWREFSYSLLFHTHDLARDNIKPAFDRFRWITDEAALTAWKRGRTGYPLVDAGMRELWATGYMHNRVRMVVASFLIKHLLLDWREGEAWFWDTLVDADPANNPASWQWVAGAGADAQPFFRIYNPMEQGRKFDPEGVYTRRWVPELARLPDEHVHEPWEAPEDVLRRAGVTLGETYPQPIVEHKAARARALAALTRMTEEAKG